jgi:hypothetical protein
MAQPFKTLFRHCRDGLPDAEGGGGGGGRGIQDVDHALRFDDAKIIHQRAVWLQSLGAHACARRMHVSRGEFGQQPLQGFDKGVFAVGAMKFTQTHAPVVVG